MTRRERFTPTPIGRATFHLPDFVFEPRNITAFADRVHNRFARFGVTEQQVWDLRGYGYGVGLPVKAVDETIREAALRRGVRVPDRLFDLFPKKS